tara:strand:+ start:11 stop:175 length:165 start_codon:yes stop_codon:yes gene_type:complete
VDVDVDVEVVILIARSLLQLERLERVKKVKLDLKVILELALEPVLKRAPELANF